MSAWSPKLAHLEDVNANDRRHNSVSRIFHRIRSGSLPGWVGRGAGGGNNIASPFANPTTTCELISSIVPSSGSHLPLERIKSPILEQNGTEMTLISRPDMEESHTPPLEEETANSTSSSTNTSSETWATSSRGRRSESTARCMDDAGPSISSSLTSQNECGHFSDQLPVKIPLLDDEQNLYSSPLSIESSPLTPRKHFTMVPCPKDDHSDLLDPVKASKHRGNQNLGLIVSALYGKLLVVMGIAFPMAEVISTYIPPSFYDGFYLYLYFGSITFMICIYGNMMRQKATRSMRCTLQRISTMKSRLTSGNSTAASPPRDVSSDSEECASGSVDHNHHYDTEANLDHSNKQRIHFGSFYLRMGAVAFGIGSMIYSGLEFGQYFELDPDTKCHNFMIALTPAVRMIFTFMQMYFIFLNSKMVVYKLELGAHFGLMHMIGTNLCVWLNVLVQETRHEILMFYNPDNGTITYPNPISGSHSKPHLQEYAHPIFTPTNSASSSPTATTTTSPLLSPPTTSSHASGGFVDISSNSTMATLVSAMEVNSRVRRGLKGPYSFLECRRSDIMGNLVQNASPFLFPCSIEYSLICAAILYVMWKSMAKINNKRLPHGPFHQMHLPKRSPHHYSVDCARANKGLFLGIFVLVMTIISLILFFVLITRPGYQALAVLEVNITEFVLYTMTTVAVLIGMCQMRELRYVRSRNLELDNILLIVAQTGSFIYNVFTIIGGHFTMKKNTALVLVTALSSLIQLLVQTLFILDASKRSAATSEQARRKPGREVVTFLLVTNLAMWAINTLEKSRADSHPVQLKFYGVWAWTIITHISMPLAIFYRFHSTVCLCEIWKRAYKVKPPVYR